MKPPERFPPDDPREWLNRARSNLAQAGNRLPETYIEDHCFNAQQATATFLHQPGMRRRRELPRPERF